MGLPFRSVRTAFFHYKGSPEEAQVSIAADPEEARGLKAPEKPLFTQEPFCDRIGEIEKTSDGVWILTGRYSDGRRKIAFAISVRPVAMIRNGD